MGAKKERITKMQPRNEQQHPLVVRLRKAGLIDIICTIILAFTIVVLAVAVGYTILDTYIKTTIEGTQPLDYILNVSVLLLNSTLQF